LLLKRLAEAADAEGVAVFEAEVLVENNKMLDVFRNSGFGITMKSGPGRRPCRIPDIAHPRGAIPLRGPRAGRGDERRARHAGSPFRGGYRRQSQAPDHRRRGVPQPPGWRFNGLSTRSTPART